MLYPLAGETRQLIDLGGIWEFRFGDSDIWHPLAVPGAFNDQLVLSAYKNYTGDFYYRTTFYIPAALRGERLYLRFGSVTHAAQVWVNDHEAGSHRGGFTPFELDITDKVREGKNTLLVKGDNILDYSTLPVGNYSETRDENGRIIKKVDENFDFFNYAGIQRPVKIWTKPAHHIRDIIIRYDLHEDYAQLHVQTDIYGSADTIALAVIDESGNTVAEARGGLRQSLRVNNPIRWRPRRAYLYTLRTELHHAGKCVDVYEEPFGMRSIEVRDNQFLINGEPFYFKGYGRHEDTYFCGRGLNQPANIADCNIMKWQGANSFRTSHYPYSEEMMRLADREGFVVIDETSAVGLMHGFGFSMLEERERPINTWDVLNTQAAHRQVIEELIRRDKNHACVVMWAIANEPSTGEKGAYEYFSPLFALARELDPQKRPCCYVNILVAPAGKDLAMQLSDVICLNRYYGWYVNTADLPAAKAAMRAELEKWHALFPDKPIMFTEYGADTVAGLHDMDMHTPFTEEFQLEFYKANHEIIDPLPYFIGEHVWNFADFQTKYGFNRVQGNKKGLFTRAREPKLAAHYFRERWHTIPDFGYKAAKKKG